MGEPARESMVMESSAKVEWGVVRLNREEREWWITTAPHIRLRLKRVFARVAAHQHGVIKLSDTTENARELFWFLQRYPMDVSPLDYLELQARTHEERENEIARLLSAKCDARPFDLAVPAREYQKVAASVLLAGGGLLLADDVGLGKTASAICTFTDPRTRPALVVTLAHLPRQWELEVQRFAPTLRTHIVQKGTPYDLRVRVDLPRKLVFGEKPRGFELVMPDVIIISYAKLKGWAAVLAGIAKSVVFDECQELRHQKHGKKESARYAAALHVAEAAAFRMGLSATPIYNYGGEIFNVMNVIHPGALGSKTEFLTEWCSDRGDKPQIKDPKAFGGYVRQAGLMLRRTRSEVGRELPPITRVPHAIEADLKELDKVQSSAAELARVVLQQRNTFAGETMQAGSELSNVLRQATGIAKAPFVAGFVRLLVEQGEKVVLYGWHREVYALWQEGLHDLKPVMYTGSEDAAAKQRSRDAFVSGDAQILIISLRAGAGLDGLQTACRTVVFGELDWSPGVHEQCVGRVARDGQKDPVVAYFLLAEHGVDPIIASVLQLKKQQSDGVRDPNAELVEKLEVDPDHIKRLAEGFLRQRGLPVPPPAPKEKSHV